MGMAIPVNRLRPLPARLWALVIGVSVRAKILGMVLALVLLLGLVITMQVRSMLTVPPWRSMSSQTRPMSSPRRIPVVPRTTQAT